MKMVGRHIALFFLALAALIVCGVAYLVNWIIEGLADGIMRASNFIAGDKRGPRP